MKFEQTLANEDRYPFKMPALNFRGHWKVGEHDSNIVFLQSRGIYTLNKLPEASMSTLPKTFCKFETDVSICLLFLVLQL